MAVTVSPAAAATGPYLVKDIRASGSSDPTDLTAVGGQVFFSAIGGSKGRELWKSDGTAAGTRRVKDIKPGPGGSVPSHLAAIGGLLYFNADDGVHGRELWVSDGTGPGTHLVRDINVGTDSSMPLSFTRFEGAVYFSADDGVRGRELWRTDGTTGGTRRVKDIKPGAGNSSPGAFVRFAGKLVFLRTHCPTAACFQTLYTTDGTAAGTKPFKDRDGQNVTGRIHSLKVIGSRLFFILDENEFISDENEIWTSRGGSSSLRSLGAFGPWGDLVGSGASAFFNVGSELWKSDGTAAGTVEVAEIMNEGYIDGLFDANGTLFLTLTSSKLYKSDGTEAGTVEVDPGEQPLGSSGTTEMAAIGSSLYYPGPATFDAGNCHNGDRSLWRTEQARQTAPSS